MVASEQAAKRTEELGQAKSALAVLTSENHKHEKQLAKEKEKAAKAKEGLKQSAAERGELEEKLAAAAAAAAAAEARCEELKKMLVAAESRSAATFDGQARRLQWQRQLCAPGTHCTRTV